MTFEAQFHKRERISALTFISFSLHSNLYIPSFYILRPHSHLQHQLRHLEPLLQAFVGGQRLMVEQAQQVISLQSLLVVALVDVQHPVLPIKVGELEAFLGAAEESQAKAKARQKRQPHSPHCRSAVEGFASLDGVYEEIKEPLTSKTLRDTHQS